MVNSSCQWEIQHIPSQLFWLRILARPPLLFWWGNQGRYYQAYLKAILHRSIFIKSIRPIRCHSEYSIKTTQERNMYFQKVREYWQSLKKNYTRLRHMCPRYYRQTETTSHRIPKHSCITHKHKFFIWNNCPLYWRKKTKIIVIWPLITKEKQCWKYYTFHDFS